MTSHTANTNKIPTNIIPNSKTIIREIRCHYLHTLLKNIDLSYTGKDIPLYMDHNLFSYKTISLNTYSATAPLKFRYL